jgi:hypothetical protein
MPVTTTDVCAANSQLSMNCNVSSNTSRYKIHICRLSPTCDNLYFYCNGGEYTSGWFSGSPGNFNINSKTGYNFSTSGRYRIELIVDNGTGTCVGETTYSTRDVIVNPVKRLPCPVAEVMRVSISPNPASSNFIMEYENPEDEIMSIFIADFTSNKVLDVTKNKLEAKGKMQKTIDVSGLNLGVYYLVIQKTNEMVQERFSIMR